MYSTRSKRTKKFIKITTWIISKWLNLSFLVIYYVTTTHKGALEVPLKLVYFVSSLPRIVSPCLFLLLNVIFALQPTCVNTHPVQKCTLIFSRHLLAGEKSPKLFSWKDIRRSRIELSTCSYFLMFIKDKIKRTPTQCNSTWLLTTKIE